VSGQQVTITWAPVSERLPDAELRVLAAYNDGRMTTTLRALYIPKFVVECYEFETDIETEYDETTDTTYYPSGWYEAIEEGESSMIGPLTGTVTHWATLPALPKVEAQP